MPAWNEITRTEQYQRLPEQARAKLKSEWFLKNLDPEVEKRPALKEVGREKVFEWFMQQPDDTGQNIITSTLGSAARGFGEVVPGAIEGAGALTGIEEIRGAGQAVRGVLEDVAPVNPIYEEGIPAKIASVGGQVGSMFATAGVGGLASKTLAGAKIAAGATAAEQAALAAQAVGRGAKASSYLSAGLQGAAGGAQEAERYGLEGADAYLRTLAGAATELGSEALPFGTLAETAAARRLLGETVQGAPGIRQAAFAEGAEEAAAQVGGNIATQALAPLGTETPGLLEGVPEAAGLGAVGGGMFGALNRLTTPRTPTVATPPPVQPAPGTDAQNVAENVSLSNEGEPDLAATENVHTPVTLDGQNYTVSIPPGSPISPDALAGFYDDPDTLQALHESGRIRLEQVIAPTETVDTTPLNNNIAASAPFAPQTVTAMKEIADEEAAAEAPVTEQPAASMPMMVTRDMRQQLSDLGYSKKEISAMRPKEAAAAITSGVSKRPIPQPAATPAQETPVAPAKSDGGSLGGLQTEVEGSIPTVTESTVPQEPVVSSAEIAPADDPFAAPLTPDEANTQPSETTPETPTTKGATSAPAARSGGGSQPAQPSPVVEQDVYKAIEDNLTNFSPPGSPTLTNRRGAPELVAKKGVNTPYISGGSREGDIIIPEKRQKRFDEIGYSRQSPVLPDDMNKRVSDRYGAAISRIKSLFSPMWEGAHFNGGVAVSPLLSGSLRGRVVAHELGHASHSLLGEVINSDVQIAEELVAVEQMLYPGLRDTVAAAERPDARFFNYLLSPDELIAEFNVERIANPGIAVAVAPKLSAVLASVEGSKDLVADRRVFPMGVFSLLTSGKSSLVVKTLDPRRVLTQEEKTGYRVSADLLDALRFGREYTAVSKAADLVKRGMTPANVFGVIRRFGGEKADWIVSKLSDKIGIPPPAATVPQEPVVSSAEIVPADDPFADDVVDNTATTTQGGGMTTRDTTKPEQMTPEDFEGNDLARAKYVEEMGKLNAKGVNPPPREFMLRAATAVAHRESINSAMGSRLPVSSAAVDTYGITPPRGYSKQGDLYIFQPDPFAADVREEDFVNIRSKEEVASEVERVDEESAKVLSSRVQELKNQFPGKAVALRFGELPEDDISTGVSDQGRRYDESGVSTYGLLDVGGVQLQRENNTIGDTLVSVKDRQPYIIVGDLSESRGRNREPLLNNIIHAESVPPKLVVGFAEQSAGRPRGSFGAYLRGIKRARQPEPPAPKPAKPKRPKKAPAPPAAEVQQQPIEETPAAPTPLAGPLRPKFVAGETVSFKVEGQPVMGTIKRVSGGGSITVAYNWNGKKEMERVLRANEIQRPVLAVAEEPNYKYTQEQNARKAARFGLPTEPGVTVGAGSVIKNALARIASDTSMPQMLRAVARALQNQNYDGVDLRIEADGRRWYAGYYLNDNGITEIGINLRLVGRGQVDAVSVLLHEALHHVTLAKVRDPQGEVETQAVEALDTLRKRIKVYAGMQQKATKFSYELGTVDEFITALFTRPDFQDFIAGIPDTFTPGTPGSKFRSVLSEIFRVIAQLVTGQKVQKGGILDQSFASTLALFETPQRAARGQSVDYAVAATAEPVFTPDEARAILTKRFGKAVADKIIVEVMAPRRMGNREAEVDAELRGGTISINLKFMDSEELLIQKAEHEMAHAVFSDRGVQDAWRELSASMPPDVRTRITDRMKEAGYDYRVLNEEVLVRFLEEVRASTSPSKWKAFMDAVIDAFRRFFGAAPDERTARLAAARIIAAGEAAVARGLDPSKQAFGQSVATPRGYAFQRNLTGEAATMKNLVARRPWAETVRLAREVIDPYKKEDPSKDKMAGREKALRRLMTDTDIDPNVRTAGLMLLALEADTLASVAKNPEDQARYDDFANIPVNAYGVLESSLDPASVKLESVTELMQMGSEAGRLLNSFKLIAAMSPDGFTRRVERIRTRKVSEATEQQFGITPQRLLELMWSETEKAEKAAVEKAKSELKRRSPEAIAKAAIARLNEMMAGPPRPRGKPSEISEMIRKHLNSPIEGFIDKLVALGVEKETAEALDAISGTVRADLAKLAEANAVKRLTESLKPKTRAAKSAIPRLLRVLLEAGKTGAFDSKAFNDALGEAFDFPPMTAEQEAEIRRMVTEINKLPQGAARVDKQQELQNYVALVQGVPARDMLLSAWYANVLSGISTQLIGLVGNSMNTALRSAFLAVTSPSDFKSYLRGALGVGKDAGIEEVKAALKGRGTFKVGRLDSPEIANALEVLFRKGPTTPAEWVAYIASAATRLRMVFRIMGAIDAFFWNSAREGMYHLAASRTVRKMAEERGMTEEEANAEFIRQLGGGPEAYKDALKDAEAALIKAGQPADMATMDRMAREAIDKARAEINPAAVQAANRWADRMVLQQEPEGVGKIISALIKAVQSINVAGFPLGQMLVPFNKIVSNLFEQSLDYTGLGLVRAALGMHISDARIDWSRKGIPGIAPDKGAKVFDEVERRERAMAGFVGLTLSAAAYVAAKANMGDDDDEVPFMVYAFGPTDKNKREQMPDGWVPFSIKIGGTYYRYAEWPLGMVLAGFGAALDAERYGNMKEKDTLDRIGYSAMLGLKGFMTQGVLSSVDTAIDVLMFKATGKKYTDIPVNAAKGLIPAQGFLRDVSGLFDNTKVSNDDIAAALMKDIPVVKSLGTKPELNVFGEPTLLEGEAVLRRFLTQRRPHAEADYLTRNKLYIPGMDETVTIGQYLPPTERDRFKRRAMQMEAMENGVFTAEQNYNFRKRAGELTKSAVERIMKQAPAIRTEQQRKAVQNLIDKQVGLARRRAMVEAVPYEAPR